MSGPQSGAETSAIAKALNNQAQTNKDLKAVIKDLGNKLDKQEKAKGKSTSSSSSSSPSRGSDTSFKDTFDKFTNSELFSNRLTDFIETSVIKYGGMIDYGVSELENRASIAIKLQAEKLTEFSMDVGRYIGSKSVLQIFGSAHEARIALAEIYDANSYYLNRIAEDYADSEDAGLEAMTNSLVVQKALRINTQDFQKIIENQMASSKKVTSKVFEEIAFFAGEYSNRTSASIFQITNQLTRAVSDFDTFGGASVENLGKLAGFMGELKMDTESVAGLIKKMQSFEGSVGIVRDLAGAFGAVIDPAKLMGDAIRDPAEALNTIRQSLLDAGHTSESLGFKITLLADSLGVSSEAMRRFLDGNIDAQGVLQNSVKATEMSTESVNKTVAAAQQQMVDTRTVAGNLQEVMKAQSEVMFQNSFKTVRQFSTDINQFLTGQASVINKLFDSEGYEKISNNFSTYLYGDKASREKAKNELINDLENANFAGDARKQADDLLEQIKSGDIRKELDKELKQISDKRQQRKVDIDVDINSAAIRAGIDTVNTSDEIKNFHKVMNDPFIYTKRRSPSQWEEDTAANLKVIDSLFGNALGDGSQIKAFQKETDNLGLINVKLNDGDGEMSLTDFTEKMEEINAEIVRSNQALQNQAIIEALNKINDNVKETKYVANITNDGTYKVVLGDEFKTQVISIAEKVVEETFKAAKITPEGVVWNMKIY